MLDEKEKEVKARIDADSHFDSDFESSDFDISRFVTRIDADSNFDSDSESSDFDISLTDSDFEDLELFGTGNEKRQEIEEIQKALLSSFAQK